MDSTFYLIVGGSLVVAFGIVIIGNIQEKRQRQTDENGE